MKPQKQNLHFKPEKTDHGGPLKHTRKRKRPISIETSNHLILRSSQARRSWSFQHHRDEIEEILIRFSIKYSVLILSYANVGNHIHIHIKLGRRQNYIKFIRAITSAIMMQVTGFSRWRPKPKNLQFWDHRPFTRIVTSFRHFKNLKNYIDVNFLEGLGFPRNFAEKQIRGWKPLAPI